MNHHDGELRADSVGSEIQLRRVQIEHELVEHITASFVLLKSPNENVWPP